MIETSKVTLVKEIAHRAYMYGHTHTIRLTLSVIAQCTVHLRMISACVPHIKTRAYCTNMHVNTLCANDMYTCDVQLHSRSTHTVRTHSYAHIRQSNGVL